MSNSGIGGGIRGSEIKIPKIYTKPVNQNKTEAVNSPQHYNKGNIETIDVILDVTKHVPGQEGYLLGNTIKYLSRYHFKNGVEDLEKARWHVNKLIELVQGDEK